MAWKTLAEAMERAIAQGMIECAATAGTDADAEKMAAALGKQQPPSQGRTIEGTKGIAGQGEKPGNANREHMPTALPTGKCFRTASPERVAPPFAVRKHLVVVVDNARETKGGGQPFAPRAFRSAEGEARETGLMLVHSSRP